MSLVALTKKWATCKICTAFNDDILNDITLDIVLQRRTYKEISDHYTPMLPPGVPAINDMNIKGHKNHCDPRNIAQDVLSKEGAPTNPSDVASRLYAEIFEEELDKNRMLNELYRERLINLHTLQTLLDDRKQYSAQVQEQLDNAQRVYNSTKNDENFKNLNDIARELSNTQKSIRSLISQIDGTQKELQEILIKEKGIEKGLGEGAIYITNNYVNIFQTHMRSFLDELVPMLLREFRSDTERGKRLISMIASTMDKHIGGALDETKLLKEINPKKVPVNIN